MKTTRPIRLVIVAGLLFPVAGLYAQKSNDSEVRAAPASTGSITGRISERIVAVAVLQAGSLHGKKGNPGPDANFELFAALAREAAAGKPDLIVFPEYTLTGWPYLSVDAINRQAEPVPGDRKWFRRYSDLAKEVGHSILGWMVEKKNPTGELYNTAVMFGRRGEFVGKYRKVHPAMGELAKWGWEKGDSLAPLEHEGIRYGISICADMWHPETVLAADLLGADIVILQSIGDDMGHIIPARAFDSEIPIVVAILRGGSYAVNGRGELLGKMPAESPGWKLFQFQPFKNRVEAKYGGWIRKQGLRNTRNPRAYEVLVDPAKRPPWTEVFVDREGRPLSREQVIERFGGRYDSDDPVSPKR